jgi:hypothetical protein
MAKAGSYYIDIEADTAQFLEATTGAEKALGRMENAAKAAGKSIDALDKSSAGAGSSLGELTGYASSMDSSLKRLNTNVTALSRAIMEAGSGAGSAGAEFSRAESILESLGNQLAILEERQEAGARSAAILAAQMRAGSKATEEEKQKIGELAGRLYDMRNTVDTSSRSTSNWKGKVQQAGYQIQDFIVQVQGGQSALIAFSQQGSQLAGAFGAGGAVVGSVIALSSVLAGVLVTSLNDGKNAMDALKNATDEMDKIITISQSGIAALSNKFAMLARVNIDVASLMKRQAELELRSALAKMPGDIQKVTDGFVSFKDSMLSAFGGGYASIRSFNDHLSTLGITTNNFSEAWKQANEAGQEFSANTNSMVSTVGALASKFDVSDQKAFELAKQLSELSKNPTPERLQQIAHNLQDVSSNSDKGRQTANQYAASLLKIAEAGVDASYRLAMLKSITDSLGESQKNALEQSRQELALSRLTGAARARQQATFEAERLGLQKGSQEYEEYIRNKTQAFSNNQSVKENTTSMKNFAKQASRNAQIIEQYRQRAEMTADTTSELSREQAILAARQKLVNPTAQEVAQVEKHAAAIWDKAAAVKAQAAAEKLIPERRENISYQQDMDALKTALEQKKVSQAEYNQAEERLEQQHQANLAKIRAQQAVTPQQDAVGQIDPVQRLANQQAEQIALIKQFEQQKLITHQQALDLMASADTEYENQRLAAQWELYRNQSMTNELMASAVDSLQSGASSAITGLINGTQSLQEAFANIGSTILNSVVSSLVEVGLQYVRNALLGQAMSKANTESSVAEASTLATAWAPAAMAASIATQGKASAVGALAYNGAMASSQTITPLLAGARYNGGPVSAGSMYRVGESGKPEIYQASNGSQYMIPGDNGSVISNRDLAGGGGGGSQINQHIEFHIQTTNGIDDAAIKKMQVMAKNVALFHIKDQSTRPGGMIQPRKKR